MKQIKRWMLVVTLMVWGCTEKGNKFVELLKEVQNQPAEQKTQMLQNFAAQHPMPFVQDSTAYFLFCDSTQQPVFLAGDMTFWKPDSIRLTPIAGTDFHFIALHFPRSARLEYKFVCGSNWYLDPFNPLKERGGLGENSVLVMPEYQFPLEVLYRPEFRKSELDTFLLKSRILKNNREIYVYKHLKSGQNSPLIFFNDGGDYLQFGKARIILDNLIGSGQLQPLIGVFVPPKKRKREFLFNDEYLHMLFKELLPYLRQKYALKNNRIALGGVSLGGLISLYALKKYHPYLDYVFSQSGAFWPEEGRILKELQSLPPIKTFLFLSFGTFENAKNEHQRLKRLLEEKNINFEMKTYQEGHNWGNWRAHLKDALLPFAGGKAK